MTAHLSAANESSQAPDLIHILRALREVDNAPHDSAAQAVVSETPRQSKVAC